MFTESLQCIVTPGKVPLLTFCCTLHWATIHVKLCCNLLCNFHFAQSSLCTLHWAIIHVTQSYNLLICTLPYPDLGSASLQQVNPVFCADLDIWYLQHERCLWHFAALCTSQLSPVHLTKMRLTAVRCARCLTTFALCFSLTDRISDMQPSAQLCAHLYLQHWRTDIYFA